MKKILFAVLLMSVLSLLLFQVSKSQAATEKMEKKVSGSISVPRQKMVLVKLKKISLVDAVNAALKHTPGIVTEAKLENEDGFLVFSVEIVTNKNVVEVTVDAGNRKVLKTEIEEREEEGDRDGEEEGHQD